jgi:Cu/Ag efflux protein CusF
VVTKVDKHKVTIKHEPVPSMNWPSMSMAFTVKDKALRDKLAKDKKVDFEFV